MLINSNHSNYLLAVPALGFLRKSVSFVATVATKYDKYYLKQLVNV
jgi:hypothetical protein